MTEAIDVRDAFWEGWPSDPTLWAMTRSHHYRIDELPATALEFLDCLRQIGYGIGELEDLDREHPHSHRGVKALGGDRVEPGSRGVGERADGGLDVLGATNSGHEGSSRGEQGAGTPDDRTVEVATDKVVRGPVGTLGLAGLHITELAKVKP